MNIIKGFPTIFLFICFVLIITDCFMVEADTCKPSGKLRGKKLPPGQCDSNCCEDGKFYTTYKCSPPVSECDNRYHSDDEPVVALSTGWFNNKKRCLKYITIHGNGKSVKAKVVDECDSAKGCDSEHGYQRPCPNNIVDASKAVWKALGVPESDWGLIDIYWSDAN
ncbi:hypothetical protein V6Z12_A12G124000 [Gossypium hirsutum]